MLGLCEELPQRTFALRPMGRALCNEPAGSFRDYILFMGRHGTRFWRRLPDCIRLGKTAIEIETGGKPAEYFSMDAQAAEDFNRAMSALSNAVCDAFVSAYDFEGISRVVDVGGGQGTLLSAVLNELPAAHGVLFDLPSVVAGALLNLEARGVIARVECVGGDFFQRVPSGADCYIAKTVIHDWQDDEARRILANVRSAMAPHARVLLYESVVGPRNAASFAKLLDLQLIVTAGGRERTLDEYRVLLASAGLKLERTITTASPLSILEARAG